MVGKVLKPTEADGGKNRQTNQRTKNAVDLERICKCKVIAKMQGKKKNKNNKNKQEKRILKNH